MIQKYMQFYKKKKTFEDDADDSNKRKKGRLIAGSIN